MNTAQKVCLEWFCLVYDKRNMNLHRVKRFEHWVYKNANLVCSLFLCNIPFPAGAMNVAGACGNVNVLQYFHFNGEDCTHQAMDWAAGRGHLNAVMYLHQINKDCTFQAMDTAAENGHVHVLQYLHWIGKECCDAVRWAVSAGQLESVRYLHLIGKEITVADMKLAIANEHPKIVTFLHTIGIPVPHYAIDKAALNGNIKMVTVLLNLGSTCCPDTPDIVIGRGYVAVAKMLKRTGTSFTHTGLYYATENGNLDAVKYLIELGISHERAVGCAARYRYFDIVQYLVETGSKFGSESINDAARGGDIDIIKYLLSKGAFSRNSLESAILGGHLNMVRYLRTIQVCTPRALALAIKLEHTDIVDYLVKYA
jgi:hypothetical protein